ncbi:MAG: hypothetical protein ACXVPN_10960 [Bacteroidia bacterium]
MNEKTEVKIRFNTLYRDEDPTQKEWRVLINGIENFCNNVQINCPTYTSRDLIEGTGLKWHISCNASKIEYIKDHVGNWPSNYYKKIVIS